MQTGRKIPTALICLAFLLLTGCTSDSGKPPNIILIVYDTVRADAAGCYGNPAPVTFCMDSIARRGRQYEYGISTAPWTLPSHASMLSGFYPSRHGARFDSSVCPDVPDQYCIGRFDTNLHTSPFYLRKAGYLTSCIAAAPALQREFMITAEFDTLITPGPFSSASNITLLAIDLLSDQKYHQCPFFLLLNYFDAHGPYFRQDRYGGIWLQDSPGPSIVDYYQKNEDGLMTTELVASRKITLTKAETSYARLLYESEIAFMDREIHRLLVFLKSEGFLDNAIVIVTADHGELFGEHNLVDHSRTLNDELLKVPLIYWSSDPDISGIIEKPTSLRNIFGTCLKASGYSFGREVPLETIFGDTDDLENQDYPMAECFRDRHWVRRTSPIFDRDLRVIYIEGNRQILTDYRNPPKVFDLSTDPLASSFIPATEFEDSMIKQYITRHPIHASQAQLLDHQTQKKLSLLGYVH